MSELIALTEDLKKEIRIDSEGKGFVTIRGAARLLGLSSSTLISNFGDRIDTSKLAKTLAEHDFDVIAFPTSGIPDTALSLLAYHYSVESKYSSEETKKLCSKILWLSSSIGIRTWIQKELGYNPQPNNMDNEVLNQLLTMVTDIKRKQDEQQLILEASVREKEVLQDQVDELNVFVDEVNDYQQFVNMLEIARDQVDGNEYLDGIYCRQYIALNAIPLDESAWCTLSRRTASFYRLTKGRNPERRGCHNIYRGKDVAFIIATIQLIIQGL